MKLNATDGTAYTTSTFAIPNHPRGGIKIPIHNGTVGRVTKVMTATVGSLCLPYYYPRRSVDELMSMIRTVPGPRRRKRRRHVGIGGTCSRWASARRNGSGFGARTGSPLAFLSRYTLRIRSRLHTTTGSGPRRRLLLCLLPCRLRGLERLTREAHMSVLQFCIRFSESLVLQYLSSSESVLSFNVNQMISPTHCNLLLR